MYKVLSSLISSCKIFFTYLLSYIIFRMVPVPASWFLKKPSSSLYMKAWKRSTMFFKEESNSQVITLVMNMNVQSKLKVKLLSY